MKCLVPKLATLLATLTTTAALAQAPKPFKLQQALSAPYATDLTAAPVGNLFAWVEDAEGRHNLYVGGKDSAARQLTHNTEDDAQDISQLAWSPDATSIAYTFGAPTGADGKPANPAHLQRSTPMQVLVQPLNEGAKSIVIGEGRTPLFSNDGRSLFFLRGGQIFTSCLRDCHPEHSEGPASPESPQLPAHQLVFDRGSASALTLSPDGNTLAFISRRRETNEPSHSFLALFDLKTQTLTFPAPSTGNDSAPAFSPDGKQLAWIRTPFTDTPEFANSRTSPTPWSIQLLDLTPCNTSSPCHPDPELVKGEGPASLTPPQNAVISTEGLKGRSGETPVFGTATTARTIYSPEPNKPGSVLPDPGGHDPYLLWTADHRVIFYCTADGWVHLYAISAKEKSSPALLSHGNYDVEGASIEETDHLLVWTANDSTSAPADMDRLHIWHMDLQYAIWHLTPAQPDAAPVLSTSGEGIETHPSIGGDAVATLASDVRFPSHPALIQANGKLASLNAANLPATYPASAFVTPQQVLFESVDGLHLHGQLFLPRQEAGPSPAAQDDKRKRDDDKRKGATKDAKKHPAILFLHGGPMRQMLLGYPAMGYYSNAYAMNQYLTSRGFIVLSVNYRCGIGYGLDFHQCEHEGATGAAEYNDVLAAQKYLAARPDVDAKRIGLWGGSYGGYLTALGLARNSDLFAAGVDFHGVHDWNLEDNASDWKRGSFAEQDAIAAKALQSSPMDDLSHWRSPILLIHGDNDGNVAYAQTPLLADALRSRNAGLPANQQVDVQELIFPDELHEFLLHSTWIKAYTAAAEFFERTLKP